MEGERWQADGRGIRLDALGLLLLVVIALWAVATALLSGGSAAPYVGLVLAAAGTLLVARSLSNVRRIIVPGAVLVAAVALFLTDRQGMLSSAPLSGPFGYNNAKAAFLIQVSIAGLMVAVLARSAAGRVLGVALAVVAGSLPLLTRSLSGSILILMVAAVAVTAARWGIRSAVKVAGVLFGLSLALTVALAATYGPGQHGGIGEPADETFSEQRLRLWSEALAIAREHPLAGVGPGRYEEVSPTARADPDFARAHHEFLQAGAEQGVVGFTLLGAIFIWGFARLSAVPVPRRVTALGAVALASLGVHASIDYVLHFPAIPITTAALVGAAIGPWRQRRHPGGSRRAGDGRRDGYRGTEMPKERVP